VTRPGKTAHFTGASPAAARIQPRRISKESGGSRLLRILYIEDDPTARAYIRKGLSEHGYAVDVADDATSGVERALRDPYDLLILDVMLPDSDGFEILRTLRGRSVHTPVLFLSARGDVSDRIRGLNLGADDYLVKPFAFAELLARIQAVARRSLSEPDDGRLVMADLVLDLRRHAVERSGRPWVTPKSSSSVPASRNAGHGLPTITEKAGLFLIPTESDRFTSTTCEEVDRPIGLIHTEGVVYMLRIGRGRQ
jgi:CheY-like chemotaxis protein